MQNMLLKVVGTPCAAHKSLVGRSERSDLRHGKHNKILCVGGHYIHSDLQFIMTIYHLEMVIGVL